jgi:hypothetical protein
MGDVIALFSAHMRGRVSTGKNYPCVLLYTPVSDCNEIYYARVRYIFDGYSKYICQ